MNLILFPLHEKIFYMIRNADEARRVNVCALWDYRTAVANSALLHCSPRDFRRISTASGIDIDFKCAWTNSDCYLDTTSESIQQHKSKKSQQ